MIEGILETAGVDYTFIIQDVRIDISNHFDLCVSGISLHCFGKIVNLALFPRKNLIHSAKLLPLVLYYTQMKKISKL